MLGNGCPDYLDGIEIVPQRYFYHFLQSNHQLLQSFLSDWGINSINTDDILNILEPSGTLKVANATAHEISFNDVFRALAAIQKADSSKGILWTNLCTKLFGDDDVASWKGNMSLVGPAALAQRKEMSLHALRVAAAEFAKQRNAELREKKYRELEDEGVIIRRDSFDRMRVTIYIQGVVLFGMVAYNIMQRLR